MMRNWLMAFAVASLCLADVRAQGGLPAAAATATTSTEIENLKLQIELLKRARETLRAQEALKQLQDEVDGIRGQAADALNRAKTLEEQMAALQEEKAKADAAVAQGAEKLAAATKQVQAREDELRKLRKDLDAQKASVSRLESELSIEKNVSEMSVKRANEVQKALAGAKAAHADELARREKAAAALAKEKSGLEAQLAQVRADLQKSAEALEARKQADAEAAQRVQDLQAALEDKEKAASARLEQEAQAKQALERQLADERAARESAAGELAAAKKSVEELAAKVRDLQAAPPPAGEAAAQAPAVPPEGASSEEVANLKARIAELEQQLGQMRSESERLAQQDVISRHCAEAFARAQKKAWLPCLESWKAAVDAGYKPDGYGYARSCMKQAFESGLAESEAEVPSVAGAAQGLEKLSLASRGETLRALYAAILEKIGPEEAAPQEEPGK